MEEVGKMWKEDAEKKVDWIRSQIIGGSVEFNTPFGKRRLTYADTTSSGRSLRFIQHYISNTLLPFYGNTHTSDSYVGQRSTKMVEEAKQYIKKCLGGKEEDAILFCGSGATYAIKRLQEVMGIAIPSLMRNKVLANTQVLREEERWVVFVGGYEHHSNLLSWRQTLAQVVEIGLSHDGSSIDMEALRSQLQHYATMNRPMLGSFSACSNVTGIVTHTRAIATLLHQYGAFACFDFAASGPYMKIKMTSGAMDGYDAIFMSPHKFIGGPGSPGVLLMNNKLYHLNSSAPSTCGGGTVNYVNGFDEEDTLYSEDIEERENAGSPPILQTVQAALAFWVKEFVGYTTIEKQEYNYIEKAMQKLGNNKNIHILGNTTAKRLAILSILIYPAINETSKNHNSRLEMGDKPLHGRFVAKLLNDLFGIQARGGCACAGPYGHSLLNIDKAYSLTLRSYIQKGYEGVKPGWTRVCFPYYMSNEEFEFMLESIEFVGTYGHRFLPLYNFNWKTGDWSFKDKALKEAIEGKERITSNKFDMSKLASFLQDLKLRQHEKPKSNKVKDAIKLNSQSMTKKFASYLETAMHIASLLPSKNKEQRDIPSDLLIDLPFIA